MPHVSHRIPEELVGHVARRLKALGDPTRLRILQRLEAGEICVGDLVDKVGGSQANVSKHLAVLREAGLVKARREGMRVCYWLDDPVVLEICRLVCGALERQASEIVTELNETTAHTAETEREAL